MQNLTKKLMSGLLSLTLAASVAAFLPATGSAEGIAYGDINGDSAVNSSDALAALTYSVGKREFTDEEFLRADVNADKKVNSADALEILRYSVGLITSFKAEETSSPVDAKTAVEAYNKAVENSKSFLPSYTFKQTSENIVDDVNLSTNMSLVSDSLLRELEKTVKDEYGKDKSTYTKIVKQKSAESSNRMLGTIDISKISELTSVEATKKGNGNYTLKIKFKDEKNSADNSMLVKVLGLASYSAAKKTFEDENSTADTGFSMTLNSFSMEYKNCVLECEIDTAKSEFVSIDWSAKNTMDTKLTASRSIMDLSIAMKTSGETATSYSNFGY